MYQFMRGVSVDPEQFIMAGIRQLFVYNGRPTGFQYQKGT